MAPTTVTIAAVIIAAILSPKNIRFFTKKYYYSALGRSLFVSIVTTCTTLLVGVPIAYIMSRYNVFGKSFIHIFIIMSLMSPPFIGAYSWIMLFGRAGFVTRLFANIGIHLPSIYGKLGIILVFTFKLFPYVYLYTSALAQENFKDIRFHFTSEF